MKKTKNKSKKGSLNAKKTVFAQWIRFLCLLSLWGVFKKNVSKGWK